MIAQPFGLLAAALAVIALTVRSPTAHALWWGALSGVGSGVGTVSLYRGLAISPDETAALTFAIVAINGWNQLAVGLRPDVLSLDGLDVPAGAAAPAGQ